MQLFEEFRSDVAFALRQLKAAPAFTLVAAMTLAFGIGANSAIFALVDAALLRPLPFGDSDRLVAVWERTDRTERGAASPINMLDWNERSRSFDLIAGFVPSVGGMVTSGADGTSETVSRQWVSAGLFDVLGSSRSPAGRSKRETTIPRREWSSSARATGARVSTPTLASSAVTSASTASPSR